MKDWKDIHTKEQLKKRYLSYVPALMKIAQKCGYCLALHGSVERDLDLVAIPWVPKAFSPESLIMVLQESMVGYRSSRDTWKKSVTLKPHGRRAYAIVVANLADDFAGVNGGRPQRHAYLDISVMPRS